MKSFPLRIYLIALVLRLVPVLLSADLGIGLDDMYQYDMLARSLLAGNGYRWYAEEDLHLIETYVDLEYDPATYDPRGLLSSHRAPFYPAFLTAIYFFSGLERRFFWARLVQAFIMAGLAPLGYALARRLYPDAEKIGRIAAVILAVYPYFIALPLALATENIFIPLVTAALVLLLQAGESRRTRHYLLAGILLGMAALTRSIVLAFLPFAALWAWFWGKHKKGALILCLCVLAFILPWSVRNTLLHDRFTLVESSMGYNLYLGYHPEGEGKFEYGISLDLLTILDDAERNQVGMHKAWEFIRSNPGRVPLLMFYKLCNFFDLERRAITAFYANNFFGYIPTVWLFLISLMYLLPFGIISTLAAFGLPFTRWEKGQVLVWMFVCSYMLPHLIILAEPRFHLALVPALAVLAGHTWVRRGELRARLQGAGSRIRLLVGSALVALLVYNWAWKLIQDADKLAILFGPHGNLAGFPY